VGLCHCLAVGRDKVLAIGKNMSSDNGIVAGMVHHNLICGSRNK
jgi:hypothetical protein